MTDTFYWPFKPGKMLQRPDPKHTAHQPRSRSTTIASKMLQHLFVIADSKYELTSAVNQNLSTNRLSKPFCSFEEAPNTGPFYEQQTQTRSDG